MKTYIQHKVINETVDVRNVVLCLSKPPAVLLTYWLPFHCKNIFAKDRRQFMAKKSYVKHHESEPMMCGETDRYMMCCRVKTVDLAPLDIFPTFLV